MAAAAIPWITAASFEAILTALMYGADKIPDSWFDKVPGGYYRAKEAKDKAETERRKQHRKRKESSFSATGKSEDEYDDDDYDDHGYYSDDYDDRRGGTRRPHYDDFDDDVSGEYRRDGHRRDAARGRSAGVDRTGYDGSRVEELPLGGTYGPRPYNPATYAPNRANEWDYYYSSRTGPAFADRNATPAAAAADRYADHSRPTTSGPAQGYVPYADIYGRDAQRPQREYQGPTSQDTSSSDYPLPDRTTTSHARAAYVPDDRTANQSRYPMEYGDDYRRRDDRDDYDYARSRDKSSHRSKSRPRSKLRDELDTSGKGLGYGALGALAGGLVGREVGKGGTLPTVAGAVIGGLGANAYKGHRDHKKESRHSHRHRDDYDRRRSHKHHSRRHDGYYSD